MSESEREVSELVELRNTHQPPPPATIVPADIDPPPLPSRRLPGPGLPEAIGWTVGVLAAHVMAAIGILIVLAVLHLLAGGKLNDPAQLAQLDGAEAVLLAGGEQALVLLLTLVAVTLRLGGRLDRLALRPPSLLHLGIIICAVLPLSLLCSDLYQRMMFVWDWFTQTGLWRQLVSVLPLLEYLDQAETMEMLKELAENAPLGVLLLIIAVAPALGEEILFRGLIGRGLVARWGLVGGVLMSSVLFGVMHIHPAHVLAVIPLGIALHLLYLATRSFWAPVLLHFLNNAWATIFAKHVIAQEHLPPIAMDEAPVSAWVLLAAALCVTCLGLLLWRTRVRYVTADGSIWSPGYPSVESPAADVLAERVPTSPPGGLVTASALSFVLLFATIFLTGPVV